MHNKKLSFFLSLSLLLSGCGQIISCAAEAENSSQNAELQSSEINNAELQSSEMKNAEIKVQLAKKHWTQEELDELKEKLQQEINNYDLQSYVEDMFELEDDLGGIMSVFLSENGKDAGMDMTSDICYEEVALDSGMSDTWCIGYEVPDPFLTEEYGVIKDSGFLSVLNSPLSTFAADVDTGSYCNMRRLIRNGTELSEIPSGAIRTEELLNYFDYQIEDQNRSDGKFSVQYELAACPWNPDNQLLLMTIQSNKTEPEYVGNNFVYLIDTSGSMDYAEKIALAKCSFKLLSYTLTENDRVSIVTYSGDAYTALESCPGNDFDKICDALDSITPYGGTNGSGGITAAYELAEKNFMEGGNNRVFIASDGDMNLGITDTSGLVDLIKKEKETGIFLTVLGFGSGNYSDLNMESIADAGNGNYYYIDCLDEAQHVLIEKLSETTVTVAKDVKFQAEFNPAQAEGYRLIGYENRAVADEDFQNDAVDGGEVGAGQQVTVLYEIIKPESNQAGPEASGLKYQTGRQLSENANADELLTLSINYKEPSSDSSVTESYVVSSDLPDETSNDMHLAASLAELSMLIHGNDLSGNITLEDVKNEALAGRIQTDIYRIGYLELLQEL